MRDDVLVVGERMNAHGWSNYLVGVITRRWKDDPARMVMATPAFLRGPGRRRLDAVGLEDARVVNLLPPSILSGEWDHFAAVECARALLRYVQGQGSSLVLLGRRVARAFRMYVEFGESVTIQGVRALVIPHPSGKSRFWNRRGSVAEVRRWVRDFLSGSLGEGTCSTANGSSRRRMSLAT